MCSNLDFIYILIWFRIIYVQMSSSTLLPPITPRMNFLSALYVKKQNLLDEKDLTSIERGLADICEINVHCPGTYVRHTYTLLGVSASVCVCSSQALWHYWGNKKCIHNSGQQFDALKSHHTEKHNSFFKPYIFHIRFRLWYSPSVSWF